MRKWLWLTLSVLLFSLTVYGASQLNGVGGQAQASPNGQELIIKKGKPLPVVSVETVQTLTLSNTMNLTGSVTPTRTARIASPGEGPVEPCATRDCMVREGDKVKKGQVLLKIGRNKTAEAQLTASRQALEEQELELQRVKQLVQGGAIPGSQLDAARSKYENARAQLAKSTENSEDYAVTAPWDGIASKVYVTEGDYVAPRAALIEIFDPASLMVQFAVPEDQSTKVHGGMEVRVQLDAHPGRTFQGKISRVFPQLDIRMRTRTVEATLTDQVALLPGMFARVQVLLAQVPDAVAVPTAAVLVNPNGDQVVFVSQENNVVRRKIQTGIEDAGRVQVISGLQPGEKVVVAGNEKLKDGAKVKVRVDKQL